MCAGWMNGRREEGRERRKKGKNEGRKKSSLAVKTGYQSLSHSKHTCVISESDDYIWNLKNQVQKT